MVSDNETAGGVVAGASADDHGAPASVETPPAGAATDTGAATDAGAATDSGGATPDVGEVADVAVAEAEEPVDPVAALRAERDEYLDSLRRLQAEFENYRKRVAKQQAEQADRAALALVDKLLPVLDALDLAGTHLGDPDSGDAKALLAASSLLNGALAKEGLERVDPLGEPFDPNAHEAVGHIPDEDSGNASTEDQATGQADGSDGPAGDSDGSDGPAGDSDGPDGSTARPPDTGAAGREDTAGVTGDTAAGPVVGQVMRAGYRWKGTVVRPAMVMVRG